MKISNNLSAAALSSDYTASPCLLNLRCHSLILYEALGKGWSSLCRDIYKAPLTECKDSQNVVLGKLIAINYAHVRLRVLHQAIANTTKWNFTLPDIVVRHRFATMLQSFIALCEWEIVEWQQDTGNRNTKQRILSCRVMEKSNQQAQPSSVVLEIITWFYNGTCSVCILIFENICLPPRCMNSQPENLCLPFSATYQNEYFPWCLATRKVILCVWIKAKKLEDSKESHWAGFRRTSPIVFTWDSSNQQGAVTGHPSKWEAMSWGTCLFPHNALEDKISSMQDISPVPSKPSQSVDSSAPSFPRPEVCTLLRWR